MRRTRFLLLASMIAPAAYGCSLDWSVPGDGGAGGGKGDGGLDASGDVIASDAPTAFNDAPSTPPESQPPVTSGCHQASDCQADSMCVFSSFDCGDMSVGICVSRATIQDPSCPANGKYCGCDGVLYDNACNPLEKGIDLSFSHCKNDQTGNLQAGYAVCGPGAVVVVDSKQPHHRQYRCELVPTGCDGGDCTCLAPKFCGSTTDQNGTKCVNGVVTCP